MMLAGASSMSSRITAEANLDTFILLAFVAYVRGDCAACLQQVGSQYLTSNCYMDDNTFCYYSNDWDPIGALCVYSSEGSLLSQVITRPCPTIVGSTPSCAPCMP
ncbi:hypothetical protein EDC04DRAFT_2759177 [Pisolithus marmoratus]|nr:hypothetical protein EDC04DRAFT_2759177 [Pisolithus marmoratus]